jgi:uncharacterized BrkB/YihY/UPF0761 family membrane protein
MLTAYPATTRDVLPGAVLSVAVFFILQQLASLIISSRLQHAQATYGHFATVIVILWWFYLTAVVTLIGARLNVVLKQRRFPRSLVDAPQTEADHRALEAYAQERTYHPEQQVEVRVPPSGGGTRGNR